MEYEGEGNLNQGFYVGEGVSSGRGKNNVNQGYPEHQYTTPEYTNPPVQSTPTTPKGRAVPVSGWNWGAFMMCPIWGIANKCYIALLAFVPFLNFVMPFIAGFKGNEWALHSGLFATVEEFNGAQRTWNRAGKFTFFFTLIAIGLYILIFGAIFVLALLASN